MDEDLAQGVVCQSILCKRSFPSQHIVRLDDSAEEVNRVETEIDSIDDQCWQIHPQVTCVVVHGNVGESVIALRSLGESLQSGDPGKRCDECGELPEQCSIEGTPPKKGSSACFHPPILSSRIVHVIEPL